MFKGKKGKRKLSILTAALVLVLVISGAAAILSMDEARGDSPIGDVNENRSQVMVTGMNYSLNDEKEAEYEEEQEPENEEPEQQKEPEQKEPEQKKPEKKEQQQDEEQQEDEETERTQEISSQEDDKVEKDEADTTQQGDDDEEVLDEEEDEEIPTDTEEPSDEDEEISVPDEPVEPNEPSDPVEPVEPVEPNEPDVPDEPEEDRTPVIITDLENIDTIDGTRLTFELEAKDYKGRRIESFNFSVYVNDVKVYSSGESTYKRTYRTDLVDGDNQIVITVKDDYGNSASRLYSVHCNAEGEMKVGGKIRVIVDASIVGFGTLLDVEQEFYEGDGVSHVVQKALEDNGFAISSSGSHNYGWYLKSISKPGMMGGKEPEIPDDIKAEMDAKGLSWNGYDIDKLGEHDFYQYSGWIFTQNDNTPSVGMASKTAEDGDVIVLTFILDLES